MISDISLISTFILLLIFSGLGFIKIKKGNRVFQGIVILLFILSVITSWCAIKEVKKYYNTKYSVVAALILEIITYIVLFFGVRELGRNYEDFLILLEIYTLCLVLSVILFGISTELPMKYNQNYIRQNIGDFYNSLSKENLDIANLILLILFLIT